jgi:glycosyltransferase involved in cell wall biosynthesis
MKVNIITEQYDWILKRAAEELLPLGWTINEPENKADIDYYLPYLLFNPGKNIKVSYFTHLETGSDILSLNKYTKFQDIKEKCKYKIAISGDTKRKLKDERCPIIKLGSAFKKEITFGVCGKVHPTGRKNEHFVKKLCDEGYKVIAWGHGWPCEIFSNKIEELESFYKSIDYLIVTSSIEGGPVPVIEALSLGVPVIAPQIGWCWDYPVIRYNRDDYDSLYSVIASLTCLPTWDAWRYKHEVLFKEIWRESQSLKG